MADQKAKIKDLIDYWLHLEPAQRLKTFFMLLALFSPFFPWFHSCNNIPGNYQCVTWHGFQWDNDIYGLLIFLLSAATIFLFVQPLLDLNWTFKLSPRNLSSIFGGLIAVFGLVRLLTFPGTSSQTTNIGPSMGLLFVLIAGLGILFCDNTALLSQIMAAFNRTSSARGNGGTPTPASEDDSAYSEEELIELLDDTELPDETEQPQMRSPAASASQQTLNLD